MVAAKEEAEGSSTLKIPKDTKGSGPVIRRVAVKEGWKMTDGEGNIGLSCNGNVHEAAHQFLIRRMLLPFDDVRINGGEWVGTL